MKKSFLIFIVFILCISNIDAKEKNHPSFDCSKARTNVELIICKNDELSNLDLQLSKVYKSFFYLTKEIKLDQVNWIRKRNSCKDTHCIKSFYKNRIKELSKSLANEKTFPKYYLETMKMSQEKFKQVDVKKYWNIKFSDVKAIGFQNKLFRYKDIFFIQPIIKEVKDYDSSIELKKLLKECYDYRFDQEIGINYHLNLYNHAKLGIKRDMYYSKKKRKVLRSQNLYIWDIELEDRKWFFIRPNLKGGYFYLLDLNYCDKLKYEGDIEKALNSDKNYIKHSFDGSGGMAGIVKFNSKIYFITAENTNNYAFFRLTDILQFDSFWDPLKVIGAIHAAIEFRSN